MKRVGLLSLLLLALLLRVSIPTGMMLVAGDGGPRLVPCPSAQPAVHNGHQQGGHDHKGEAPPCPFGVLLFPALPPAPPLLALQAPAPEPLPAPQLALSAPPRGPAHDRPPATGPPLLA